MIRDAYGKQILVSTDTMLASMSDSMKANCGNNNNNHSNSNSTNSNYSNSSNRGGTEGTASQLYSSSSNARGQSTCSSANFDSLCDEAISMHQREMFVDRRTTLPPICTKKPAHLSKDGGARQGGKL